MHINACSKANEDFGVGERVLVQMQGVEGNQLGTVRYVGATEFEEGTWIGIEFAVPVGKNDGEVKVCIICKMY